MSHGFWNTLQKPFFVLAPMADVTDAAFRRVIAKYGKPDVMWTEFVSADGLVRAPEEGKKKLLVDLIYSEAERPIVAQFFTSNPEHMEKTAELAKALGFDGIDINMGCPDKTIEKQKAGAAMMKDPKRAKEVIAAAVRGGCGLPISVKTRIGYNKNELEEWLPHLLDTELSALTIHARTRKEMSSVPARWEEVAHAVAIRDRENKNMLILGNGDVSDIADATLKVKESGADGVMLGRAIFGNPWLFGEGRDGVSIEERLRVMVEHTKLFEELLPHKSFAIMKKHYKAYVTGFDGAHELRAELMATIDASSVELSVEKFLHSFTLTP
ncbi:MAG: tRNA-dihydrouridine synthase [Patescibacteria group bacterium]